MSGFEQVSADLASGQWGMLTTAQAAERGVSRLQLSRMASAGVLDRVTHGVYRYRAAGDDRHAAIRAAWLALDPTRTAEERLDDDLTAVVASHSTAALLHDAGDLNVDRLEFTLPHRRQTQRAELRLHRAQLDPSDVTIAAGIPTTTLAWTIVDLLADRHDAPHVAAVFAAAVRTQQVDLDTLADLISPHAFAYGNRRGDGGALVEQLLELAGLDRATLATTLAATSPGQDLVGAGYLAGARDSALARLVEGLDLGVDVKWARQIAALNVEQNESIRRAAEALRSTVVSPELTRLSEITKGFDLGVSTKWAQQLAALIPEPGEDVRRAMAALVDQTYTADLAPALKALATAEGRRKVRAEKSP